MDNKEAIISSQREKFEALSKLHQSLETQYANSRNVIIAKTEDIEIMKKNSVESKERYEREFELVSSSLYNLGISYWNLKMEHNKQINENPTWLIKERQKFFNGDF